MSNTKKDKQFFTVARVFFLLIVIPLSLMAILIANGIFKLGVTVKEKAVTALDPKSQEGIKVLATNVADEVAGFLTERKKDLLVATILPQTEQSYKQFVNENKKDVWAKVDGKIVKVSALLYPEMSLIDKNGMELIKIVNGEVAPKDKLVNVANPANTTYKNEEYFAKAKSLNKGEVYVSNVTGSYVSRPEFEKGQRFAGVIRFATPVFDQRGFAGVLEFALDVKHLAEFTDHIIPTQAEPVYEADTTTGNYAYMVDNRGYVISHPSDYHIVGQREDGTLVAPLEEKTAADLTKKGEEVLNINLLGFMDPNLPQIASEASQGKAAGMKIYKFGGREKFVAYAPIKFTTKDFPNGFGWIGMGIDVDAYNAMALKAAQTIEKEAKSWTSTIILIMIVSMVLLFFILYLLSRGISRSIAAEIPEGSQGPGHYYSDEDED
ncbi:MAG: cache domain-containing protein [Syntrophaceae bacterium]|nr:cache domain-containing protein [Syntrophaceae bacterium]